MWKCLWKIDERNAILLTLKLERMDSETKNLERAALGAGQSKEMTQGLLLLKEHTTLILTQRYPFLTFDFLVP